MRCGPQVREKAAQDLHADELRPDDVVPLIADPPPSVLALAEVEIDVGLTHEPDNVLYVETYRDHSPRASATVFRPWAGSSARSWTMGKQKALCVVTA